MLVLRDLEPRIETPVGEEQRELFKKYEGTYQFK